MKKVIVTSFDKNYMNYSKVMVKTLARSYHGEEVLDVICLCPENLIEYEQEYRDSIDEMNINIIFRTADKFKHIDDNHNIEATQWYTKNAYHRLFVGSALPEYDIAIYIDPDTIINRDIDPILKYPIKNKISAVLETINLSMATFKNSDSLYFNSGVMIIDLNFWRDENVEDKVLNWVFTNSNFNYMDQDCLNSILLDYISPLPFTFNFYEFNIRSNPTFYNQFNNPIIMHFVGELKPWKIQLSKYADDWKEVFDSIQNYS